MFCPEYLLHPSGPGDMLGPRKEPKLKGLRFSALIVNTSGSVCLNLNPREA